MNIRNIIYTGIVLTAAAATALLSGGCKSAQFSSIDEAVLNSLKPKTAATAPAEPGKESKKPKKAKLIWTYNAFETAVTNPTRRDNDAKDIINRLFVNFIAKGDNLEMGYSAKNIFKNFDTDTYFGRHALFVGKKGTDTYLCGVIKAGNSGLLDAKIGVRNTSLIEKLGGKGFIDATAEQDSANLVVLYNLNLGKGYLFQVCQASEYPFKGLSKQITELQLSKDIVKGGLAAFARAETIDFDEANAKYTIGFLIK